MNSWEKPDTSTRDQAKARRESGHAASRKLAHAVAEREQGRHRLKTTTVTVSFASVVVAGVVMAVLPGSTHAAVKLSGTSSNKSASSSGESTSSSTPSSASSSTPASSSSTPSSSSSSSDSSGSSSNSGTFQAPTTTPVQSSGGGSTSGGS